MSEKEAAGTNRTDHDDIEWQELVRRVRCEFLEMPGLKLSLPQASRLFAISQETCARVLGDLAADRLLSRTVDGRYSLPQQFQARVTSARPD
jgi:hypothetical protein